MVVLMRVAGVITFNPILTQRGVPFRIRAGLTALLTIITVPTMTAAAPDLDYGSWFFLATLLKELFIGFLFSYVIGLFYYLLIGIGEVMDTQFGMSMSKIFDPGTNLQMGITDKILSFFFVMYFFLTNSHLYLIKTMVESYNVVPAGVPVLNLAAVSNFCVVLLVSTFSLVVRLTFPFIAAHFVLQICLGILMKLIPQIHIFVLNIDMKILLTILMLLVMTPSIANFIDAALGPMFTSIENALYYVGS
jgi:flagellar biosynthetic protein FliR